MKKLLYKLILLVLVLLPAGYLFFIKLPGNVDTANFTVVSDTLSNSRLSYKAGVASGSLNSETITIDGSGNGDNNTNHLFPKDVVCFTDAGQNGCIGNTTYTVANVISATSFNITVPLGNNLDTNGYVVATQSAIHTVVFTLTTTVPNNGDILVTIPSIDVTGQTNDGLPDAAATIATNGFDLATLGTTNITVGSSGCNNNWTVAAVTAGTASTDNTIRIDRSTDACANASIITLTIGDGSKKLINPAPFAGSHTQGTADVYTINVITRDGGDNQIDTVDIKVAPVEAVLVSATVDETLSFLVAGIASSTSTCGISTDVTTTATSIPWGTMATANSFLQASQQLTASTNADGGYSVKIEENDQMGKDGVTCTGAAAGESVNCIKDTACNSGPCTESTSAEWTTATNNGLGYSLANVSGTDASFLYNESARTFSSKQIADQEVPETKQNIMSNANQVSGSSVYVCYQISISATQPAGYYYNKVKYTATATF